MAPRSRRLCIAEGEIVGLAGLEGNGQKEIISAMGGALRHRRCDHCEGHPSHSEEPGRRHCPGWPSSLRTGSRKILSIWRSKDNITLSCLQEFATRTHLIDRRARLARQVAAAHAAAAGDASWSSRLSFVRRQSNNG